MPARTPATAPVRPRRTWDLVLTIVLLVALVGLALLAAYFALFLVFLSDGCGGAAVCDTGVMTTGVIVAIAGPLVLGLAALIAAIVLLVKRRLAFWVPLAGMVLVVASWYLGAAIAASGLPG